MSDPQLHGLPSSQPVQKSGCGKPVLFGCLGIAALALIIGVGAFYWVATKGKTYIVEAARDALVTEIEGSTLPAEQRLELTREIDRLAVAYSAGDIGIRDITTIIEEINEGAVMTTIKLYSVAGSPIAYSGFTAEEREAAFQTLNRFIVGVFDGRIPRSAHAEVIDPLLVDPSDHYDLRYRLDITDEELAASIARAKEYADQAGVGETDVMPDLAAELRRIVNRVLDR